MLLRTFLFYLLLVFWTVFLGILCLPFLFLPIKYLHQPSRLWILGIFFLLKHICNISHKLIGLENIPQYPVLIASKHQSAFETFALYFYLSKSTFIHKKQLFFIPIFGQYLKKINMISIDRNGGVSTIRKMFSQAKKKIDDGFSIIIFPEGTRKKPGDIPDYKSGFVGLYKELNIEILPVAVNSGKYWPKHSIIKKPGNIIIKFLPIIKSQLDRKTVLQEIENKIEKATNKII
jgi:1-acyl-sn-glycerol-3-phosphate acyltransferase